MSIHALAVPLLVGTVAVLIYAEFRKILVLIYIFKPLSTLLVISVAILGILSNLEGIDSFALLIVLGLVLSFGGDLALMPPDSPGKFRIGLLLFLAAHLSYIAAFRSHAAWSRPDLLIAAVLLIVGIGYFLILRPGLGAMTGPVAAYILIITMMLSRALSTLFVDEVPAAQARYIAAGASLFFLSDLILSANRFLKPWRWERFSLVFYFGGQLCLALSVSAAGG